MLLTLGVLMIRFLLVLGLLLGGVPSTVAHAQAQASQTTDGPRWVTVKPRPSGTSLFAPDSKLRLIGITLLFGVPDGIAPGVSFHPWTNLVHLDLSLTGALSLGFRAGVTLDPFDWIVAPTLTLSAGYSGWADLPFTTAQAIRFQATYINVQPGIEVGRRSRLRLFLRAGYSHLWVDTDFWPSYSGKEATSPTKVQIDLLPSLNLGITGYL